MHLEQKFIAFFFCGGKPHLDIDRVRLSMVLEVDAQGHPSFRVLLCVILQLIIVFWFNLEDRDVNEIAFLIVERVV